MSGMWLVSYGILWLLVITAGLVIFALAREVELLHKHFDALIKFLGNPDRGKDINTIVSEDFSKKSNR